METRAEKISVLMLVLVVLVASAGVYINTYRQVSDGGTQTREEVGRILFVDNMVHRKFNDSFIWNFMRVGESIFLKDALYIGESSSVKFNLNDGSFLSIGENSLVVLDGGVREESAGSFEVTEIRLVQGNMALSQNTPGSSGKDRKKVDIVLNDSIRLKLDPTTAVAVRKDEENVAFVAQGGNLTVNSDPEGKGKGTELKYKVSENDALVMEGANIEDSDRFLGTVKNKMRLEQRLTVSKTEGVSQVEAETHQLNQQLPSIGEDENDAIKSRGNFNALPQVAEDIPKIRRGEVKPLDPVDLASLTPAAKTDEPSQTSDEKKGPPPSTVKKEIAKQKRPMKEQTAKKVVELPKFLEPNEPYYCVSKAAVNLFQSPTQNSRKLSVLPRSACGSILKITRPEQGHFWAHVLYEESEGWIESHNIVLKADLPLARLPSQEEEEAKKRKPKKSESTPDYYNYFQNR